jgi:hypothetical protein
MGLKAAASVCQGFHFNYTLNTYMYPPLRKPNWFMLGRNEAVRLGNNVIDLRLQFAI